MPKPKKSDTQAKPSISTPDWPPLRPLLPAADLSLEALVPDQIYLIHNFLPRFLMQDIRFFSRVPTYDYDARETEEGRGELLWSGTAMKELATTRFGEDEYDEYDEDRTAPSPEELARRAREVWGGEPLGLNPNIRIYRYSAGQFFAQHYDESNALNFLPLGAAKSMPARTTWTLLIYLTTCSGGETVFLPEPTRADRNPEPITVVPEMGMALFHRHGDQCMLHEGKEVTNGEKWVLRSDLVVSR
ncbi:uncharacterized protein N7443_010624 [Penicillium atrosanguineum]|uniref:uncharacterized protein n=1 Tax=Penicillium atrosanguineum TaxID=1132637 RepID=UPI0023A2F850|nr:uncharacterized protein N7443_010624 [Penicillium atrosanguineum]KAJ5290371.1 hypothetical protein N7443_010624 [Penicillium atrosanguineum]